MLCWEPQYSHWYFWESCGETEEQCSRKKENPCWIWLSTRFLHSVTFRLKLPSIFLHFLVFGGISWKTTCGCHFLLETSQRHLQLQFQQLLYEESLQISLSVPQSFPPVYKQLCFCDSSFIIINLTESRILLPPSICVVDVSGTLQVS